MLNNTASGRLQSFRLLSARETQLILLASEGLTDKEIAQELQISVGTVVTLWSKTRAKLGIKSRVSAVAVLIGAISRLCSTTTPADPSEPATYLSGMRLLISGKHVVLAAGGCAGKKLSARPGSTTAGSLNSLATFRDAEGYIISSARLPWVQAIREGSGSSDVRVALKTPGGTVDYVLTCRVLEDPILNRVVLLEFEPSETVPIERESAGGLAPTFKYQASA